MPILLGTTRDECALFTTADHGAPGVDDAGWRIAWRIWSDRPGATSSTRTTVRAWPAGRRVTGRDLWTAVTTDYVFRLPLQALAAAHAKYQAQTYSYLFTWESPFLNGMFGSCHGLEIPFVFGTVEDTAVQPFTGAGPQASLLSEQMQHAWVAFARDGDPSCDAVGSWPAYDPDAAGPPWSSVPTEGSRTTRVAPERLIWEETGTAPGLGHHHD